MDKSIRLAKEIRYYTTDMINHLGFGHLGGSLSIADLLAVLYASVLNVDPQNPRWEDRDYLVLSKGHAAPALYSVLALQKFFPIEKLYTLNTLNTDLPSHADGRKVKGIDATTGSLGQGFSIAAGYALGIKLKKSKQQVYCIVGDGELDEGQCWEAAEFIAHQQFPHFTLFVDHNYYQLDGKIDNICKSYSFEDKFKAFGWDSVTIDGHDHQKILKSIKDAHKTKKPTAIILETIKGKGLPFLEKSGAHHLRITPEQRPLIQDFLLKLKSELEGSTQNV